MSLVFSRAWRGEGALWRGVEQADQHARTGGGNGVELDFFVEQGGQGAGLESRKSGRRRPTSMR